MHIEPGFISQAKLALANVSAIGVLAYYLKTLVTRPADIIRTLLAAVFFFLFMQSFHVNVGPSELHFIGAMAIYLTLGFIPALFGFALGLLLQGLLFEPVDLPHLAVNSLSLIVPLIAVHFTLGRKLLEGATTVTWKQILKLDAAYYSGVVAMVGFWLSIGYVAVPLTAWATWASSYLVLVAVEPLFTYATLRLLKRHNHHPLVNACFAVTPLKLAE